MSACVYHSHPGFRCWLFGVNINTKQIFDLLNPRALAVAIDRIQFVKRKTLIDGLSRHYYSIATNYRKNQLEKKMLLNLHKKDWTDGLILGNFAKHTVVNEKRELEMSSLARTYNKSAQEELIMTAEQPKIRHVGKQDPKHHLEDRMDTIMGNSIVIELGAMISNICF